MAHAHFDGTVFDGAVHIPERLAAIDSQHIQLFYLWLTVDVSNGAIVYEPGMESAIRQLAGRGTVVWLAVKGGGAGAEERAVMAARHVADLASSSGLRVALYPHYGFYLARFEDVLRIAEAAGRSNLGVTFNLCHELRAGLPGNLPALIQRALPRLYAVTVNGADRHGADWKSLIQPLGQGDFDVTALVKTIFDAGYRGPIGIQCYGISEPPATLVPRTRQVWTEMTAKIPETDAVRSPR